MNKSGKVNIPSKEFILEVTNILKNVPHMSATSISEKIKKRLPLELQPPKKEFQKWMGYLTFVEKNVNMKVDMPFYRLKIDESVNEELILLEKIKNDSKLWYDIHKQFKTSNNIEIYNTLSNLTLSIKNNIKIIEEKFPKYFKQAYRYNKNMPLFDNQKQKQEELNKREIELNKKEEELLNYEKMNTILIPSTNNISSEDSLLFSIEKKINQFLPQDKYLTLIFVINQLNINEISFLNKLKFICRQSNAEGLFRLFDEIEKIKYNQNIII